MLYGAVLYREKVFCVYIHVATMAGALRHNVTRLSPTEFVHAKSKQNKNRVGEAYFRYTLPVPLLAAEQYLEQKNAKMATFWWRRLIAEWSWNSRINNIHKNDGLLNCGWRMDEEGNDLSWKYNLFHS